MQSSLQFATPLDEAQAGEQKPVARRGELLYQVMTIAAMLIVLVSIWVF
jgi:hypothetical protein